MQESLYTLNGITVNLCVFLSIVMADSDHTIRMSVMLLIDEKLDAHTRELRLDQGSPQAYLHLVH